MRDVFISTNGNESDIRILTDVLLQNHSRIQREDQGHENMTSPLLEMAQNKELLNEEGSVIKELQLSVDHSTVKTLVIGVNKYSQDKEDFLQALALEVSCVTITLVAHLLIPLCS